MTNIISEAETDTPPTPVEPADNVTLCAFPGCTNEIVRNGRGRPPKYCPEHANAPKNTKSSTGRASGPAWPQAGMVEKALTSYLEGISWGVGFLNPTDALILSNKGPAVVHELVELGRTDKTLRKYLMYLATPGKYGPLSLAVFGLIFPIAMNHNLIPIPKLFGMQDDTSPVSGESMNGGV